MAQSTVLNDGSQVYVPGTYVVSKVEQGASSVAAAGVVSVLGESNEGPSFRDEADLNQNVFTPDQLADVIAKYGSGRVVDAFKHLTSASNDDAIAGAVSQVRIIVTNSPTASASSVVRSGFGSFAQLTALRKGAPGNMIKYRSEIAQQESAPSTSQLAYAPLFNTSVAFSLRVNGQSKKNISVSAKTSPIDFCALCEDTAKGILASGGAQSKPLTGLSGGTNLIVSAPSASELVIQLPSGDQFNPAPAVGDIVAIPAAGDYIPAIPMSSINGGGANIGSYIVTSVLNSATNASIRLKAINISGPATAATTGSVGASESEFISWKPVTIKNASGQSRQSTVGMSGQFAILSNDSVNVVVQAPAAWSAKPQIGDIVTLASAFGGLAAGFYQTVNSSSNTITMVRLSNGTAGSTSAPANIVSPIAAGSEPFVVAKQIIDGTGKSLEIIGSVESILFNKDSAAPAGISNSTITSSVECKTIFTVSRSNTSESFTSGGDIALKVSCDEEVAVAIIDSSKIDIQVNSVSMFQMPFSEFKTLADVASFISSRSGFSASIGSSRFSSTNPADLDRGTFGISGAGARIKKDAKSWASMGSSMVSISLNGQSGLPEAITPDLFLSGGSKGNTSSADVVEAIDACEFVETNFMVSLFAQDSSDDIYESETESGSTYTIDAINAYMKSHQKKMSSTKARKNRICLTAKSASYIAVKEAAGELSSSRAAMAFQEVQVSASDGSLKWFQPWMAAVNAAGMQAAAGYKGIVKKFANVNGIRVKTADFNSASQGALEDALKAGLLVMERVPTGGFRWVSDQMTYGADNNFVYNSLQAMYVTDLIALSLIDTFDRAIVGQSVADMTASAALALLASEMFNFMRIKWIAPSSDAPMGFKNAKAKLKGGVMEISVEVKLAGLIYFCPVYMAISQVQQEA